MAYTYNYPFTREVVLEDDEVVRRYPFAKV